MLMILLIILNVWIINIIDEKGGEEEVGLPK